MQDAWRAYLELALGVTEASRRRAEKAARDIFHKGSHTAGQVQTVVEELLLTSRGNRAELAKLVRYEVDRALGAVGLATAEEVAGLTERIDGLERRLRESEAARLPEPTGSGPGRQVAKRSGTVAGRSSARATGTRSGRATRATGGTGRSAGAGGEDASESAG